MKSAKVYAGLAVRSKAHHFPFIAVGLKAEILRELSVKKAERIGPGMVQM